MNTKKMYDALHRATRGGRVLYHTGLLMRDRQKNEELNVCAAAAWDDHMRSNVRLVQKRVSPGVCDYFIVKVREA